MLEIFRLSPLEAGKAALTVPFVLFGIPLIALGFQTAGRFAWGM